MCLQIRALLPHFCLCSLQRSLGHHPKEWIVLPYVRFFRMFAGKYVLIKYFVSSRIFYRNGLILINDQACFQIDKYFTQNFYHCLSARNLANSTANLAPNFALFLTSAISTWDSVSFCYFCLDSQTYSHRAIVPWSFPRCASKDTGFLLCQIYL